MLPPPGKDCLRSIDVMVLAGGLGTRIQPVLGEIPKLLAPIAGKPFLACLLKWLRQFHARRVLFGLGHRAAAIQDYLRTHPPHGMEIETVVEPRPLGTAGALRFARAHLRSDPVLVLNGDSFVDADLCELLTRHRTLGVRGTILCANVPDAGRFGRVVLDTDGRVDQFAEKDPGFHGSALVNAGVYMLSAGLLDDIAHGDAVSLEHDVFERLAKGTLGGMPGAFAFIDIGTPESLSAAATVLGPILHQTFPDNDSQ